MVNNLLNLFNVNFQMLAFSSLLIDENFDFWQLGPIM